MKFKSIFILFNAIIVISFLFVFLMPLFILGIENTGSFWVQNWYLILVFVGVLAVLDLYFLLNWKVFRLLEKEDWSGLAQVLEDRIFRKNRFGEQNVRLLCNAYVVQGKSSQIAKVEQVLREKTPRLVLRYGLLLGIPHLVSNNGDEIVAFYGPLADDPRALDADWMKFNLAFGLLVLQKFDSANDILASLSLERRSPLVQILSLYLLDSNLSQGIEAEKKKELDAVADSLRKKYTGAGFERLLAKSRDNLQAIVLGKFINEAAEWLFSGRKGAVS